MADTVAFPISSEEKNARPLVSVLFGRNHINSKFHISDIRHNFATSDMPPSLSSYEQLEPDTTSFLLLCLSFSV